MADKFPWRSYSPEKLQQSFNSLVLSVQKPNDFSIIPYKRVGAECTNAFFQYVRLNTPSQKKKSCVEMWGRDPGKVMDYHDKRNKDANKSDLFGTIVFMFHAPAHFSPYAAAMVYRYFGATSIFDPYAGWGDRCVAAMALGIDYTGIDSNKGLIEPFQTLIDTFSHTSKILFISGECERNLDYGSSIDVVFTSPPFWNDNSMLEKYSGSITNFDTFLKTSLFPIMDKCFAHARVVCLYINEKMYSEMVLRYRSCDEMIQFKSPTNNKRTSTRNNIIYCWILR